MPTRLFAAVIDTIYSSPALNRNVHDSQPDEKEGHGIGQAFFIPALACSLLTVLVGALSITMHLKNYRRIGLQRMVVRIMLMPPLYAIASLISLLAPEKAILIDAGRDVYEAFVIYCFFHLLLSYLGGEREMLIMLHGREPKTPLFPMNLWRRELDGSDPYQWLWMKRGILQYVQIKPILAILTLILKLTNTYQDGSFKPTSGYLYISIIYNLSICLALFSLASFWVVVSSDLEGDGGAGGFRPVPKFLCVKGVLVLTFWQGLVMSGLVEGGVITHLGNLTNGSAAEGGESIVAVALTDLLVCLEMPLFAIAHMWAFSHKDFVNLPSPSKASSSDETGHMDTTPYIFVARLKFTAALKDSFSLKDVWEDTKSTLKGDGMDYRTFEPSEGAVHLGEGRERRMRAGLRYTREGSQRLKKYWLPDPAVEEEEEEAPLLHEDEAEQNISSLPLPPSDPTHAGEDHHPYALTFPSPATYEEDEELYLHARNYLFGDYNYPVVDVSGEEARRRVWDEEERVLRDERGAWARRISATIPRTSTPISQKKSGGGYGAVSHSRPQDRVVDHGANDVSPDGGGVRLGWTKLRNGAPKLDSASAPPPPKRVAASPMIRSPSHRPGSRSISSPSTSNNSPRVQSPILPNDAVDLVVADDSRRLRRVYGLHGEDHEDESESPGPASPGHVRPQSELQHHDSHHEPAREDTEDLEGDVGEVVGVMSPHEGPSVQAVQMSPPAYVGDDEENNPWA